jgi:hypothetical protein
MVLAGGAVYPGFYYPRVDPKGPALVRFLVIIYIYICPAEHIALLTKKVLKNSHSFPNT